MTQSGGSGMDGAQPFSDSSTTPYILWSIVPTVGLRADLASRIVSAALSTRPRMAGHPCGARLVFVNALKEVSSSDDGY